jgi:UDP-glucuronate 4-epimerase
MERALGKRARRRFMPLQAGDVLTTHADVEAFCKYTQFRPATPVEDGVERFAHWYRGYYGRATRARVA